MAASTRHIIRRQILEIQGLKEEDARQLQSQLTQMFQDKIIPLLDKYLSAYSPNGIAHRIDRLELDLGKIPKTHLLEAWPQRIEEELKKQFQPKESLRTAKKQPQKAQQTVSKAYSHLDLFSYFVETGNLPWWVDRSQAHPLEDSLNFLVAEGTLDFQNSLINWMQQAIYSKRILQHFRFPKWLDLLALFFPEKKGKVRDYFTHISQVLQSLDSWKALGSYQINAIMAQKLFSLLSLNSFTPKLNAEFCKSYFLQLSLSQNISYESQIAQLQTALKTQKLNSKVKSQELQDHIQQLWEEVEQKNQELDLKKSELLQQLKVLLSTKELDAKSRMKFQTYLQELENAEVSKVRWTQIHKSLKNWKSFNESKQKLIARIKPLLAIPSKSIQQHKTLQAFWDQVQDENLTASSLKQILESLTVWQEKEGRILHLLSRLKIAMNKRDLPLSIKEAFQLFAEQLSKEQTEEQTLKHIEEKLNIWEETEVLSLNLRKHLQTFLQNKNLSPNLKKQFQEDLDKISQTKLEQKALLQIEERVKDWQAKKTLSLKLQDRLHAFLQDKSLSPSLKKQFQEDFDKLSQASIGLEELKKLEKSLADWQNKKQFSQHLMNRIKILLKKEQIQLAQKKQFQDYLLQLSQENLSRNKLESIEDALQAHLNSKPAETQLTELAEGIENLLQLKVLPRGVHKEFESWALALSKSAISQKEIFEITSKLEHWKENIELKKQLIKQLKAFLKNSSSSSSSSSSSKLSRRQEYLASELNQLETESLLNPSHLRQLSQELAQLKLTSSSKQTPPKPKRPDTFSEIEELYVNNGGLVILWPFLTRFFENMDLVSGRNFVDEASQHRAAVLLQYLADGQEEVAEYDCGLNKILCGLAWDEVLDIGEPLSDVEKEASEQLLQALIAHASILGEMSSDGFRGSFLLRKAILRSGSGKWELLVEKESYDVVLAKFPWNWGMVKLPWMEWGMEVVWGNSSLAG